MVVLENGKVAARGAHAQLLEDSELYREIAEKGLPDQVFLTRDDPEREVAGLRARATAPGRALRAVRGEERRLGKLRHLATLPGPTGVVC